MSRPVRLLLIRHAVAEPRGADWPDDRRRPLSVDGAAAFARLAARLASRLPVDHLCASRLTRAWQTARLFADSAPHRPQPRRTRLLEPGTDPARAVALLRRHAGQRLALVGHEPGLSALAAVLVGRPIRRRFRKGAIWVLDVARPEPGGARLRRVHEPDGRGGRACR